MSEYAPETGNSRQMRARNPPRGINHLQIGERDPGLIARRDVIFSVDGLVCLRRAAIAAGSRKKKLPALFLRLEVWRKLRSRICYRRVALQKRQPQILRLRSG